MDRPSLPPAVPGERALVPVGSARARRAPDSGAPDAADAFEGLASRPSLEPDKGRRFDSYA